MSECVKDEWRAGTMDRGWLLAIRSTNRGWLLAGCQQCKLLMNRYTQLVDQFEGVSYGDKLFGHFLLIPLQQRHSGEYRKLVWGEHTPILRLLPAKWGEPLFPYENLIEPRETDPTLLTCYLNALVSEKVQIAHSPVLYHAAAEHVVSFIASYADTTLARQLTDRIVKLENGNASATECLRALVDTVTKYEIPYENVVCVVTDGGARYMTK
uniref:RPAP1/MINIYO-like TPR repeats domain-containing protein n=1 Tax=Timema douglasi TaxID=61478 RepID=A0A7R8V972_TIMDO|nr:unnamed protein product [Timema douglasi]